ncbi:hypothetical protein, conserved [Babesia bigemina]|uniref:C3H1-type domain-containing protein n=1 Tax=Babesia bigemina TaxID=5866 RepID=A0A061BU29_BABBI|nr:hypothetical protein, conserved [Babesia bigemina]CDR71969.1 hypothetical protein, conserved [Babesia bigemina]|eukprot:XP_012770911.1 hypothetical protein, conserved [Babesia bigemina]
MTSINHDYNLCPVTLLFPSSTSCHCADHVPPRELGKEFGKILNLKNTLKNNPTNILTNLCTGLEKFLGFNSDSKGYDGTGIVYSDLDRLCDGVMGFLSGVLEAVKNENEVTTYDNYITGDNKKLKDVLDLLNNNIGSGRTGLVASVGAVKGWLGGYEEKVNEQIEKFKEPMETMKIDMNKYDKKFETLKNESLQHQHDKWRNLTRLYLQNAQQADEARKTLDSALCKKLETPVKVVEETVKAFYETSMNSALMQQAQHVDNEMTVHQAHIVNTIIQRCNTLNDILHKEFTKILESIGRLSDEKRKHINDILNIIGITKGTITSEFGEYETNFKKNILTLFSDIRKKVESAHGSLQRNNAELHSLVDQAEEHFATLKQNTISNIAEGGTVDSIEKHWFDLQLKISRLVNGVNGTSTEPPNAGLSQVVDGIKQYALMFNGDGFKTKVEEWVRKILKEEEICSLLKTYYKFNKNEDQNGQSYAKKGKTQFANNFNTDIKQVEDLHPTIIEAIKTELQTIIGQASALVKRHMEDAEASRHSLPKIRMYVKALNSGCNQFATELGYKLKDTGFEMFLEDILHAIGRKVKAANASSYSHYTLKSVVHSILRQLVDVARQTGPEIERFTVISHIEYVETAMKKLEEFGNNFYKPQHTGNTIDAALKSVREKIANLDKLIVQGGNGSMNGKLASIASVVETLEKIQRADETGNVEINQKAAEYHMEVLKGQLFDRIRNVETNVKDAEKALTDAIIGVETAVGTAHDHIQNAVKDLKVELLRVTENAFTSMVREVKSLFAESHRAHLAALRSLVDRQLKAVQDIIAKDRVTGVKGMLKTLSGVSVYVKSKMPASSSDTNNMLIQLKNKIEEHSVIISQASPYVKTYLRTYLMYIIRDIKELLEKQTSPKVDYSPKVTGILDQLEKLFDHLEKPKLYAYDHTFVDLRNDLNGILNALHPSSFADSPSPLLAPLKAGLAEFAAQLGLAYVNRYSGKQFEGQLWTTKRVTDSEKPDSPPKTVTVLTPEGRNCAKVCLTIVEILVGGLTDLSKKCELQWSTKEIHRISGLGTFLSDCGYVVSNRDKQDGELQRSDKMTGNQIRLRLKEKKYTSNTEVSHLLECETNKDSNGNKIKSLEFDFFDVLKCLHCHLETYYTLGHMASFTAKRNPCSVYEMLIWCAGLHYNSVYEIFVRDGFTGLMEKPKKKIIQASDDGLELDAEYDDLTSYYVDVFPSKIRYGHITAAVDHICATSHDVLTRIIGHGDEYTTYGVDFCNNSLKFRYPTSAEECLDMFLDILRRLFPPLKYLEAQCSTAAREYGWAGCHYGKDVQTTNWPCSEHSSSKVTCQPNDQAKCEPNCQPKSPLMSYLNDCLPGHLPHVLSDIGCKAKCTTCPRSMPGMPCLTPLGFRGFSGTKREGRDICNVLGKFFDNGNLKVLFSLQAKTPSTLPEHFGFALSFVKGWNDDKSTRSHSIKQSIEASITDRSINLYEPPSTLTDKLRDAYGSTHTKYGDKNHLHAYADLSSLAIAKPCTVDGVNCAPYLSSLCIDSYHHLAKKQSNTYLSWAIYLPWTFWDLLNNLYNAFCSINCQDWGCRGCLRGDKCKKGEHGVVDDDKPSAICQCPSIVDCKGVAPTLYQFGFVFGEASTLNDKQSPKKCSDFCSQLKNVLTSEYFVKLFEECDNFLWKIREPFSYLVVALWLLSVLYLIHIMVIRLDLLHIKSHLHSPSSHRIAAQSLLAAARVNKLNRVFYLQP